MKLTTDQALTLVYYGATLVSSLAAMYHLIRERIQISKELKQK